MVLSDTGDRLATSPAVSPTWFEFPCPSRPKVPSPQHLTVALSRMTHVWSSPDAMSTAVRPVPRPTVGSASPIEAAVVPRFVESPTPS